MSENNASVLESRISEILRGLVDTTDGLSAIFLVDVSNNEISVAYPEQESTILKQIGAMSGENTNHLETQPIFSDQNIHLLEMEMITNKWRIFTSRFCKEFLLCLVGDKDRFRSGLVKMIVQDRTTDSILAVLEEVGINITQEW